MIKELVKLANRLDNLKLFKEADLLDRVIKKISGELGGNDSRLQVNKMILDAIGTHSSEEKIEEIVEAFKASCLDTIKTAEKIFAPEDGIQNYLELLHPLHFDGDELTDLFGEEKVEAFSMESQSYYPEDFISALDLALEDESGRIFLAHKQRARNLKRRLETILKNTFRNNK